MMTQNPKSSNITWHHGVSKEERQQYLGQKGCTIWFTGLSASGKSTIACMLEKKLLERKVVAYRLDGDHVRMGLNSDLGFSPKDREENIRRISQVAKLFTDACLVTITCFISPYQKDREFARKVHAESNDKFIEVFVDCPLEELERRDPKGLYKKARAGEIKGFTGIDAPYEAPQQPELHLRTDMTSLEDCVQKILDYLDQECR